MRMATPKIGDKDEKASQKLPRTARQVSDVVTDLEKQIPPKQKV